MVLRTFFIDSFIVKGDSMAPTILNGDYAFVDKISYRFKKPNRENIIVVKPRQYSNSIIKRIIGLPGERIEITEEGQIVIKNDRQDKGIILSETYLNLLASPAVELRTIQLDPKEYFVIGDNRYISADSRELGPMDEWDIEGRVFLVVRLRPLSIKFP